MQMSGHIRAQAVLRQGQNTPSNHYNGGSVGPRPVLEDLEIELRTVA
jgi:hypothetical protein